MGFVCPRLYVFRSGGLTLKRPFRAARPWNFQDFSSTTWRKRVVKVTERVVCGASPSVMEQATDRMNPYQLRLVPTGVGFIYPRTALKAPDSNPTLPQNSVNFIEKIAQRSLCYAVLPSRLKCRMRNCKGSFTYRSTTRGEWVHLESWQNQDVTLGHIKRYVTNRYRQWRGGGQSHCNSSGSVT